MGDTGEDDLEKELGVWALEDMKYQNAFRLIEQLKWSKVCLFAGGRQEQQGGITNFTGCINKFGDCDSLIFCEPRRVADQVHKHILETDGTMIHGAKIVVLAPKRN